MIQARSQDARHWRRYVIVLMVLVFAPIGSLLLGPPKAHAEMNKTFGPPEEIGSPLNAVNLYDSAYGKEDGHDVVYTTVSGSPAVFQVVDLQTMTLLRTFELTGVGASWSHLIGDDGRVYVATDRKIFRYSPVTKQIESLSLGDLGDQTFFYGLSKDEQGRIYGGTYPGGKAFQFDPATGLFRNYGQVIAGQQYVRATAYHDGYLYAGIGTTGQLAKIDVVTGAISQLPLPQTGETSFGMISQLDVAGDYLFATVNGKLALYDLAQQRWDALFAGMKGLRLAYDSTSGSPFVYFVLGNSLRKLNLDTLIETDTGIAYDTYLRGTGWVQGKTPGSGLVLATVSFGGSVIYMDLNAQTVTSEPMPLAPQPISVQALENGPDGRLYMSGYPGGKGVSYDPATQQFSSPFALGQAEGIGSLGGKLYFGIYPGARIQEAQGRPDGTLILQELFQIPGEDRPFVITSGAGKLLIGTIPEYGHLGGALTICDSAGPPSVPCAVYDNLVPNQSIVGLAYRDGKIYGSTSVYGGLGSTPSETTAKLFVWDMATRQLLTQFTPVLPGATAQPKMISGLSFGPDGRLWGAVDGVVFALNPDTYAIEKSKLIYTATRSYGQWRPVYTRWDKDGFLYMTLNGKITVIDPGTLEHASLATSPLMTLGEDGHIYYMEGTKLKKIPVSEGGGSLPFDVALPLVNPGFEEPLANGAIPGWNPKASVTANVYYTWSQEHALSGTSSLKLTDVSATEWIGMLSASVSVTPGTEYTASTMVYLKEGRALAYLRFYNANQQEIGYGSTSFTTNRGMWQPVEWKAVAPPGAVSARLELVCSALWQTQAYFDDVRVTYKALEPKPAATVVNPAAPTVIAAPDMSLTVQAALGTTLRVYEGGQVIAMAASPGTAPFELPIHGLAEGPHTWTLVPYSVHGQPGDPIAVPTVTIDIP